jgi:hypothetical protein
MSMAKSPAPAPLLVTLAVEATVIVMGPPPAAQVNKEMP